MFHSPSRNDVLYSQLVTDENLATPKKEFLDGLCMAKCEHIDIVVLLL
jgi:hypothetical protein